MKGELKYWVPSTHEGDLDEVLSSLFYSVSALAIVALWEVN